MKQIQISGYLSRNFELPEKDGPYFVENALDDRHRYSVVLKDVRGNVRVNFPEHIWAVVKDKA